MTFFRPAEVHVRGLWWSDRGACLHRFVICSVFKSTRLLGFRPAIGRETACSDMSAAAAAVCVLNTYLEIFLVKIYQTCGDI